MGTTSEELKKLYAKLGGKDPKVAGFSAPGEILNAINEIPLPTEYELPTVTTEDAGDVLVVNEEGKWDKGEAGGGLPEVTTDDNGDILQVIEGAWNKGTIEKNTKIITGKYNSSSSIALNDGVTTDDILNLLNNNIDVIIIAEQRYLPSYTVFRAYTFNADSAEFLESIYYSYSTNNDGSWYRMVAKINPNQANKTILNTSIEKYPSLIRPQNAQTSIEGKFLKVVNDKWVPADPPTPTHAYSTTEQVVGTWIDDKPVYEVSILVPSPTFATWGTIFCSTDISRVISLNGVYDYAYGSYPLGYTNQNEMEFKARFQKNNGYLVYMCSHSYEGANLTFTLRYTKTTD